MTYNSYIGKKRAYTARDTANEYVYFPPWTKGQNRSEHGVTIVAVLNERAVPKCPVLHKCYGGENIQHDNDSTQEYTL